MYNFSAVHRIPNVHGVMHHDQNRFPISASALRMALSSQRCMTLEKKGRLTEVNVAEGCRRVKE